MNLFNNICTRVYVSAQSELRAFAKNEQGVTAIEYAVIAVAMTTLVLAAFNSGTFQGAIKGALEGVAGKINPTTTTP